MKKKIYFFSGTLVVLALIGVGIAANYFYGESVKRGKSVDLYSGASPANTIETNAVIEEANSWYNEQTLQTFELTSFDGLVLKANYLSHHKSTGKAVILAHGYRGNKEDMSEYVKLYYDLGFDVLIPDARGHGESEGDYIGYGWHDRKDYQKWIQKLIDEEGKDTILLHGNSMGAALVLMASGEKLPQEVKGFIADSGYTSVQDELTYQLKHLYNLPTFPLMGITSAITNIRAGYTFEEASAIEQVKKNTRPLLIIHGNADQLVPTKMANELYEAADGNKELWIVSDAGHTEAFTVAPVEFQKRVEEFVQKATD